MSDSEIAKSIRNIGFVYAGIGILGLYSIFLQYGSDSIPHIFKHIVILVFALKLLMGVLIILHIKLGLYYLLLSLKIVYLGFPIGTQISVKYSKYVKHYLKTKEAQ